MDIIAVKLICAYLAVVNFNLIKFAACQTRVPSVNDPFPANPGPELTTTTSGPYTGCPAVCSNRLDGALRTIMDLENKVMQLNLTLNSRLNSIPSNGGGGSSTPSPELNMRVSNLEVYLPGNITTVTDKLSGDLSSTRTALSMDINDVRKYIDSRLDQSRPSTGGSGQSDAVYGNITARLDTLEYSKVQTLIDENNVWRKNFQVVNKTFSKMRKSSYSNDVIVVG